MNKNLIWALVLLNSWVIVPAIMVIIVALLAVCLIGIILYFIFDFIKFIFRKRKKKKEFEILEETKFDKDFKRWQVN